MHDEKGYVQFLCDWERGNPPAGPVVELLCTWRNRLHQLRLIGVYPDGIGYGNLSCRHGESFVITGTATGALKTLGPEHLTEVINYHIDRNWLRCRGPVQASSESLSHAAIYRGHPAARAVIHVHHSRLWKHLCETAPVTAPQAEAGTPAMAHAIETLLHDPRLSESGVFAMGGHRDGIMAFGSDIDEAGGKLLEALEQFG
jgi:hypothetical protein